ncbi:UbiA family prenyltransferase [Dyadobacter jiangsuensis]|uniref:4-hydroxybenzoate polyprenyltransferase n=1 Tax=Dyadobacter jiangsuensis TaxID=1591085 RepID=A0A2P8GBE9_9BACT|nr:UbiA family prenyltransferase [Dyadobacter jiangsuensis]PSL31297.1 4-hydroxybenzoate polyprenyltransferase [Dyadobacter jiangsuensis]
MNLPAQGNAFSNAGENNAPFFRRFYIYQKERFPLLGHGLLVAAFSFSAISYSRICRGAEGFVDIKTFAVGIFTTISLFLLVRIFDEFKDAEDDARFRKELPIPRGLVTFRELAVTGIVVAIAQILVNLVFFPKMLWIYAVVIGYLSLMGKEFFVAEWLKKHQFWYVTSHMFIIPLVDIYASGLDWLLAGQKAPEGLFFFFAVSYMNGIVLEVGRKIRAPQQESEGVLTYTSMLGVPRAIGLWLAVLAVTLLLSMAASVFAGYGYVVLAVLGVVFLVCALPAILFWKARTTKQSKMIEYASALWTIAMYLTLGAGPMISKLLFH